MYHPIVLTPEAAIGMYFLLFAACFLAAHLADPDSAEDFKLRLQAWWYARKPRR